MVLCEFDAPFTQDLRDGPLAALDTIRDAYTPVAAAGEGEAGDMCTTVLDQFHTLKMPKRVLRHAEVPPEDARK
jgi:hypothetical protein